MRFLFVHQSVVQRARDLLSRLGVHDVKVIVARQDNDEPLLAEMELLREHPDSPAAACQINRKYRRSIQALVRLEVEPKVFRDDDQILSQWLVPPEQEEFTFGSPIEEFEAARRATPRLVLAPKALDLADSLVTYRWSFAAKGARVLARHAQGDQLGAFREWKANHGVEWAGSGRVRFTYTLQGAEKRATGSTEWHLKEGDSTTANAAARIYFDCIDFDGDRLVVVLYCGPHPDDGEHKVYIRLPRQS